MKKCLKLHIALAVLWHLFLISKMLASHFGQIVKTQFLWKNMLLYFFSEGKSCSHSTQWYFRQCCPFNFVLTVVLSFSVSLGSRAQSQVKGEMFFPQLHLSPLKWIRCCGVLLLILRGFRMQRSGLQQKKLPCLSLWWKAKMINFWRHSQSNSVYL